MSKLGREFVRLDYTETQSIRAEDIPYDAVNSVKAELDNKEGALGFTPVDASTMGAVSGVATLDGSGKLTSSQIPPSLVGSVVYQGSWDANANSPALSNGSGSQGQYYVVGTAGTTSLDGIGSWAVGDWVISNGTTWEKVENLTPITTVVGRIGDITLAQADITGLTTTDSPTFDGLTTTGNVNGRDMSADGTALDALVGKEGTNYARASFMSSL